MNDLEIPEGMHRGIRLKLSVPGGTLTDVSSDVLYWMSERGIPFRLESSNGLLIEAEGVMLPDEYPDDDYYDDQPDYRTDILGQD